ncbi:hypothetical protein HMSSN036_68710 [Paenibacillus macerans]|nr:hypothetical protein HMSSN036_68710 [Paenibacillus macerans]
MTMFNQAMTADAAAIPRPEFPRPDWERKDWFNLNGAWAFRFDPSDEGIGQSWQNEGAPAFREQIQVPFSWSSPLSGIGVNEPGIGWYRRTVAWQPEFGPARIFCGLGRWITAAMFGSMAFMPDRIRAGMAHSNSK